MLVVSRLLEECGNMALLTSPCASSVVIHYEGFLDNNAKFFPKEVAIISLQTNVLGHWIISPEGKLEDLPHITQQYNNKLTKHHHGLEWCDGEAISSKVYEAVRSFTKNAKHIYTWGVQQTLFTEKLLDRKAINVKSWLYKPIFVAEASRVKTCILHSSRNNKEYACALQRVSQTSIALLASSLYYESEGITENPFSYINKVVDEYTPDFRSLTTHTRSYSRSIPLRQDPNSVDETDSNCSEYS